MKITGHVKKLSQHRRIFRYFFPFLFIFLVFIFGSAIFLNSYHTNPNIAKKYSTYRPKLSPLPSPYKFTDTFSYNSAFAKKNILSYIHKFLRPTNMPPDDAIDVVQAYIFCRDKTPDLPYTFGTSWSLDPDSKSIMKAIFHYNEKANKERDNTIFITFDQVNKP